ncbi:MAG: hypothetical protein DRO87_08410 [Candidatus Thorarchaeota archaeon]|nr:MAG: hypothetical protein DRO87_08410 [Candidatus Thorarchaeota archaeon]
MLATSLIGLFGVGLEVTTAYKTLSGLGDLALALIGMTVVYVLLVGYVVFLLSPKDPLARATATLFGATGILFLVNPPMGFVFLMLSNVLASVFFILPSENPLFNHSSSKKAPS